ncbi:MAG: hypothetical protein QF437_14440 [Planctomycetota bacterium]|nr:hypothetical protein [Planctomycetota bacterium]
MINGEYSCDSTDESGAANRVKHYGSTIHSSPFTIHLFTLHIHYSPL